MIKSFKDKRTEALFRSRNGRGFPPDIVERARRKLAALNAAHTLDDLRVPPSNHLEQLKGDRAGQHSIRINDQWRILLPMAERRSQRRRNLRLSFETVMQFIQDDPIHPGEILKRDFLEEYGLSEERVATDIGVAPGSLSDILAGRADVTAETALRLSRYFDNSPEFWLNLQRAFDLAVAVKMAKGLDKIRPVKAA